jgi:hypothetical protein
VACFLMSSHHLSESTEQSVIGMHFEFDNSLQLCGLTSAHVIMINLFIVSNFSRKCLFVVYLVRLSVTLNL